MTAVSDSSLHLPNLTIRRFRGIQDLSIERLGRVTLIAGKNSVGKTTVLDAVRTYAARGHYAVLASILTKREELVRHFDGYVEDPFVPDWEALFYGRRVMPCGPITIGPTGSRQFLSIEAGLLNGEESENWAEKIPDSISDEDDRILTLRLNKHEQVVPLNYAESQLINRRIARDVGLAPGIRCESLGPSVLHNTEIARLWDKVALTDDENRTIEALRLVFGEAIERVAVIGDEGDSSYGRRVVVRMAGQERPVPLRSLGDGAVRLFGVALALANSQGGFLLIDEAENGIHHTIQRDFWRMVLLTAEAYNVQVFATTHSWDCVVGFAQAAVEEEGVAGALVRLDSDGENIRVVEYSERQLHVAAEQGIEVR